jgi:battenin
VLYQLGVFISRSSVNLIEIPVILLPLLAILQVQRESVSLSNPWSFFQLCNAVFFFFNAIYFFVPHIAIVFGIILFEGFLGGASYVNTFHAIHKKVSFL